jgi:hypothetical protein
MDSLVFLGSGLLVFRALFPQQDIGFGFCHHRFLKHRRDIGLGFSLISEP